MAAPSVKENSAVNAAIEIARQPEPSATVARFLKRPPRLLIGGEWVESRSAATIPVIDPATGLDATADVLITDGKIAAVGPDVGAKAPVDVERVDAAV